VHPCPHHEAVAHAPAASADHGAAHGDHAAHPGGTGSDVPAEHHGSCTCLSSCVLETAAPLPEPAVFRGASILATQRIPVLEDAAVLSILRPYVLPYATAPPARLV
jgi:hypothetical protein